jgi:hypothetical protein
LRIQGLSVVFYFFKESGAINMSDSSPYVLTQRLERAVTIVLTGIDLFNLKTPATRVTQSLKKRLIEARLDVRDYELSETREEQLTAANKGKRSLEKVRKDILVASEYDIFNPVDVAQITAQLEIISEQLV